MIDKIFLASTIFFSFGCTFLLLLLAACNTLTKLYDMPKNSTTELHHLLDKISSFIKLQALIMIFAIVAEPLYIFININLPLISKFKIGEITWAWKLSIFILFLYSLHKVKSIIELMIKILKKEAQINSEIIRKNNKIEK